MLKITSRILFILLICVTTAVIIFQLVEYVIDTAAGTSLEGSAEFFKWLRQLSSMGMIGVIAHAVPFVLAVALVALIERQSGGSKN